MCDYLFQMFVFCCSLFNESVIWTFLSVMYKFKHTYFFHQTSFYYRFIKVTKIIITISISDIYSSCIFLQFLNTLETIYSKGIAIPDIFLGNNISTLFVYQVCKGCKNGSFSIFNVILINKSFNSIIFKILCTIQPNWVLQLPRCSQIQRWRSCGTKFMDSASVLPKF